MEIKQNTVLIESSGAAMKPNRTQSTNLCLANSLMPVRAFAVALQTCYFSQLGGREKHSVHPSILFSWQSNTHSNDFCEGKIL